MSGASAVIKERAMKLGSLALALAGVMGSNIAFAGGSEPISDHEEPISEVDTNPAFSYIDPYSGQMGIELSDGDIVIDTNTDRLYIATSGGQLDVSLPEAATAYAQEYAGGDPYVAQQFLAEMRTDLRDQAFLFAHTRDFDGNGWANETYTSTNNRCSTFTMCNSYNEVIYTNTIHQFRNDFFTLGPNGGAAPRPPTDPDSGRLQCQVDLGEAKDDADDAFINWGLSCGAMAGSPILGGAACVAAGAAAAKKTKILFRKAKECKGM